MCPPAKPCDQYTPDYNAMRRSGHLRTGFGYSPPCTRCGRNEIAHQRVSFWDDLELED